MTDPLRVIHFTWSARIGGIERLLVDLTEAQRKMQLCVPTILLGEARAHDAIMFTNIAASPKLLELDLASGFDFSASKLHCAYKHFRAHDLIHLHAFNPTVAIAACLSRRPVVYTEHGVFGGANQRGLVPWLKRRLFSLFIRSFASAITCNSQYTKRKLISMYGLGLKRLDVIYNGTKLDGAPGVVSADAQNLKQRLSGAFVVGTFSRLHAQKRIDRLLKAFATVSGTAFLLVAGDGPAFTELKALADKLGIADRSVFLGAQKEILQLIQLMDVCVFPAIGEGFGLAALEALAIGKPTIVFDDGGGLVEIIQPLAAQDVVVDEAQLAGRIEDYRLHPCSSQLAEARRTYARRFSIERMADEMQRLYASLISSTASARALRE